MESEHSLKLLQMPAACPCPEPDRSSPCPPHSTSWRFILYPSILFVMYKKFCSQLMNFFSFSIEQNLTVPPLSHLNSCTPTKSNLYCSRNATVAQSKNCQFGVYTATGVKNVTSDNNGIWRCMTPLRSVPVLSEVATFHHHHYHHVPEGLGVFPVPWSSRWSWSLHLFLGCPMFLRPFGLYCSACFGSLFVSILSTCCSHFFWYCFISFTMLCAPVSCLMQWLFSLSSFVIPRRCLKNFICAASKRCSSLFFCTQASLPKFNAALDVNSYIIIISASWDMF